MDNLSEDTDTDDNRTLQERLQQLGGQAPDEEIIFDSDSHTSSNSRSIPSLGQQTIDIMTNPSTSYSLGGKQYTVKAKAVKRMVTNVYYPKSDRAKLDSKQRMDLIDKIQSKQQTGDMFRSLTVSVKDPQKMTTTKSLVEVLEKNKRNLMKYDLLDTYMIVFPEPGAFTEEHENYGRLKADSTGKPIQKDLFAHYLTLTAAEVASSSRWYSGFLDENEARMQEDLNWSLAYYEKNTEESLYSKVHSKLSKYPTDAQGGPLFLKLMLEFITTSTEANLRALETILDTYSIKQSCPGEDIEMVVGLFTSIIDTINALREGVLPADTVKRLLRIFQTTSVNEFNAQFDHLERSYIQAGVREQLTAEFGFNPGGSQDLKNDMRSAKWILAYAEGAFREQLQSGNWDEHLQKTAGKSAFANSTDTGGSAGGQQQTQTRTPKRLTCDGCGSEEHMLKDCPNPDQERVAKARAERANRRRPHKWRLPEPHENNRRVIDGKPYTWNPNTGRTGRWMPDQTPSSGQAQPPVAPPSIGQTVPSQAPAQINVGSVDALTEAMQALGETQSRPSSGSPEDNSTIASETPAQRKLRLYMIQARIADEISRIP